MKFIDNYRDLPIGMYLEICEIDRRTDIEELHKQVSILSILSGMDEEEIYDLPIGEYKELAARSRFLSHSYEGEILTAKTYICGEWVLTPVEDYRKITTAQYIDFQSFAKDAEKNIVEILSTMLIPKGKKYNQDYDIIELQNALREYLSVADALSLLAFFFVQYNQSIKDSLISSKEAAMKLRDPEKRKRVLKEIQKQEQHLKQLGVG
jgi:hypothetical protein